MGDNWRKNIKNTPYGDNQEILSQFDEIDDELLSMDLEVRIYSSWLQQLFSKYFLPTFKIFNSTI